LLDYADNVERHFPDGDIYNPRIKAGKATDGSEKIEAKCPQCAHVNEFSLNGVYAEYPRDEAGYCKDVFGERIMTEYGPMPAHFGRRCFGMVQTGPKGEYDRCTYRWTGKDCPECGEKNDIAARYCYICKAEIVDPNDKLIADFKALKRDPTRPQTDVVLGVTFRPGISPKGNRTIRADWVTPYRQFSTWHLPEATHTKGMRDWQSFERATGHDGDAGAGAMKPETISYCKELGGNFYRVLAYNQEADAGPEEKPRPFTPSEKANVEKGNHPHAPAEPVASAADSKKR
jgi:DNA repair protein RadD